MARSLTRREGLLVLGVALAAAFWLWRSWGTTDAPVEAQPVYEPPVIDPIDPVDPRITTPRFIASA